MCISNCSNIVERTSAFLFFFFFFFFLRDALPLEPCSQNGFAIFQVGSHIFPRACLRPLSSYLWPLCSWDHRHIPPHLATDWVVGGGELTNFFSQHRPQTLIFQISTSQVNGIIGMSQCALYFFAWDSPRPQSSYLYLLHSYHAWLIL
jgi:hypothetical protein